ncbi:MAG: TraI/MobA(P) family conjugative relaxase [Rhodomicrobium sp.]
MIAKRVMRSRASSDFARLSTYILGEGQTADKGAVATDQTFDYILADQAGGRVGAVRITNCNADTPTLAIMEILATQSLNKRSRGDRTYHLVVSFEPGERPTPAQIETIENELCAAIGLSSHQRISALHLDRAHLHLHIAINKVDPATLRCVEPYYDKRKLMKACDELEIKHGLARTNHGRSLKGGPKGRAADFEAHSGQASFSSWVKGKIEAPLITLLAGGCAWDDVHALLGKEGLALKKRGAGLVMVDATGRGVRASAVNRAFSMQALTTQLGAFQVSPASQAQATYQPKPLQGNTRALFAEYTRQRQQGADARKQAREASSRDREDIFSVFAKHRAQVKRSGLTRTGKRGRRLELQLLRTQRLGEAAKRFRATEEDIDKRFFFTWIAFLQDRAARGDVEALWALRSSGKPAARAAADFITARDTAASQTIILQNLRPTVRKNGDLAYQLGDGGVVTDEKERIRVDRLSYQAVLTALSLGEKRFRGQTLVLDGTASFKRQAAEVAAALRLNIVFDDDDMEKDRLDLIAQKTAPAPVKAVADFVAEQNSIAQRRSGRYAYRLWTAEDAGEAIYRGVRTVDGHQVLLLQRGAEVLVRPASPDEVEQAKAWRVDAAVHYSGSSRGRTRS